VLAVLRDTRSPSIVMKIRYTPQSEERTDERTLRQFALFSMLPSARAQMSADSLLYDLAE
jgi:hypothetical protein